MANSVLRLVSTRGKGSIAGFSKDPAWPGWIPLQSFSFDSQAGVHPTGSSAGSETKVPTEVFVTAKMSDLDVTTLHKWVMDGEPASAQVNLLNPRDGKKQSALIFNDVLVASFSLSGDSVGFSLNFNGFKQMFFAMSFP